MALPSLFARRQILLPALYRGNEVLGIDILLAGYDSLCAWNGGYVPEIEAFSPGRLLIAEGIQMAFRSGLREYDLLRGSQEWKQSWTNGRRNTGRVEILVGS